VIGIVASRLRERYRKPAVIIGLDPVTGIGKGSGRSQTGVNLGRAVQAAFDAGLLMSGGGHAMAAGLTVRRDGVPELREFLCRELADERACAALADAIEIDAVITPRSAIRPLVEEFERMQPFGPGNPEPLFALADVRIEEPIPMRGDHIRCQLTDASGARLRAIAWRAGESELGRRLIAGGQLHVAGRLKPDDWNGRNGVQLEIEDAADPRMSA
jgi:single-stranded-DNA-specific exonuclease